MERFILNSIIITTLAVSVAITGCNNKIEDDNDTSELPEYIAIEHVGDKIDFAILGLDGFGYFYKIRDDDSNIPERLSIYDGNKSKVELVVNFDETGLPKNILSDDFTVVLGKYEGKRFSAVVITKEGGRNLYENIETDISWDEYKNSLKSGEQSQSWNPEISTKSLILEIAKVVAKGAVKGANLAVSAVGCGMSIATANILGAVLNCGSAIAEFGEVFDLWKTPQFINDIFMLNDYLGLAKCGVDYWGCFSSMLGLLSYEADRWESSAKEDIYHAFNEIYGVMPYEPEMVFVEGGSFFMGEHDELSSFYDAKPIHRVTLSSFKIGKYEVTQGQWEYVMGNNPSAFKKGNNYPVEQVNWYDAQEYISRLNQLTGKNYRLPTEAEWEYAARGRGYFLNFSGSNNPWEVAWFPASVSISFSTQPVGTKAPNQLGIHDMSGNVWEWCNDWFGSYTSSDQTNPKGPESGVHRVLRGGSWKHDVDGCRVYYRGEATPESRDNSFGFRVVLPY